tara:strand:- start:2561 stop:3325 length:765 start_codon:yes stop_codon:yes gene_type:complete
MSRLRANLITNKTANGAPTVQNGLIVTGVATATNVSVAQSVTATTYYGSGANLTGIDATSIKHTNGDIKAQASATGVTITGNLGVSGVVTYEDVTNVDSVGIVTARAGINLIGNDLNVGSNIKLGNASGIVTASSYRGDGSQLTGISVGIATEASTVTDGNTTVLNLAKDDHKVLASGVVTVDVTGGTEGDSHTVRIENVGVATVGFATHFLFPSGGTPALPTASGAISIISFTVHKAGAAGTSLLTGVSVNFS